MFTGIIQTLGSLSESQARGGDRRLWLRTTGLPLEQVALGDSICVSGVCLTVVEYKEDSFAADVSLETLDLTSLGRLSPGDPVNLELALTPESRLGGHLVTGHVDGLAQLRERRRDARSERFVFEAPGPLARYIAAKGSVALDGVSLTVNAVDGNSFSVNLIPHTLEQTTLRRLAVGDEVNLEVDILARYVARMLDVDAGGDSGLTHELLKKHGFA